MRALSKPETRCGSFYTPSHPHVDAVTLTKRRKKDTSKIVDLVEQTQTSQSNTL